MSEPKLTVTATKLTSFYTAHRSKIPIADVLIAVAFALLVM